MDKKISKIAKIITFKIADHWFALPMATVLKIVNCPPVDQGGIVNLGMVQLGSHTIHLLDLYSTFGLGADPSALTQTPFLLVLRGSQKKLWGIVLEAPPDLIDLPNTLFKSVSTDKRFTPKKQWISHIAVISKQDISRTL
ncbi:MAG: chemotaxis protein CheW [Cyanobacteria bacterium J06626_26]